VNSSLLAGDVYPASTAKSTRQDTAVYVRSPRMTLTGHLVYTGTFQVQRSVISKSRIFCEFLLLMVWTMC